MTPDIEIKVVHRGFVVFWTDKRGINQAQLAGNRDVLKKIIYVAADEVRPSAWPALEAPE